MTYFDLKDCLQRRERVAQFKAERCTVLYRAQQCKVGNTSEKMTVLKKHRNGHLDKSRIVFSLPTAAVNYPSTEAQPGNG